MKKLKLLFASLALLVGSGATWAYQTPVADGVYYIYNEYSGKFLSRGADWGTQAVADDYGTPIKLVASGDYFQLQEIDNGVYYGDDYWMYADCSGDRIRAYSLEAVDGVAGGYYLHNTKRDVADNRVYVYLKEDAKYCIAGNAILNDNISDDGQTVWKFLSQTERDALIAANVESKNMEAATAAGITVASTEALISLLSSDYSAIDATSSISSASLENGYSGWTLTQPNRSGSVKSDGNGFECYEGRGTLTQSVTGLLKGLYKVTINGFHRDGNNAFLYEQEHTNGYKGMSMAYIDANGYRGQIKPWASDATSSTEPNGMGSAKALFGSGKYLTEVYTYVGDDGKLDLTICFPAFCGQSWYFFDNVTLTRYKSNESVIVLPSSITLNQTGISMTTSSSQKLVATVLPENADDKSVTWSSNDESVAIVSEGVVTALKAGTAVITATANGGVDVKATCTVTVTDAAAPAYFSTTIAAGDYYIMNAATGKFLGGANSWGTQASVIEHGIPFTVAVSDGKYTLDSHTYNNSTDHFFNGTYVDGTSTPIYITAMGDGKFSISTVDGSAYVAAQAGNTTVVNNASNANNSLAQWYFLSKTDRNKMLAAATALNPVDVTYYVKQANPSRNLWAGLRNESAWSQYSVGGTQDNSNYAAQVYNEVVDNYQIIENIPNGTYTVTVQAFSSGTDVKFYANDQKVDVKNNDSGAVSCAAASALFAQGLYPNTVTVTVTDRTLKIGFEGDCSGNKWLCWDKVEMYMTAYTANTGVTASIDKAEIEAGQTAQITAATDPTTASFNAITFASEDETIATVDENGVVTGVGIGSTNIIVTANEMENFSESVSITVTAVTPTAIEFDNDDITLNKENPTATLTVVPTPTGANTSVTWQSSD